MPLHSLGLASDVLVLRGQSTLEEHPDRFILRSPNEPDYWFGNTVIFKGEDVDPDAQISRFKSDFPNAKHITIQWDQPEMKRTSGFDRFAELGFEIDETDVLTLTAPMNRSDTPNGISIRPLESDVDWAKATELQGIIGVAEGRDPEMYLPYIKTRMEICREQTREGFGVWFGAFAGDELAGDLGVYADKRTARFQAVETREAFRRQGICAALVTAGVEWALARHPDTNPVIIADQNSDAGRIYRRCGFEQKEKLVAVYKGSDG